MNSVTSRRRQTSNLVWVQTFHTLMQLRLRGSHWHLLLRSSAARWNSGLWCNVMYARRYNIRYSGTDLSAGQNPCWNKAELPEKCRYKETQLLFSFLSDLVGWSCPAGVTNVTTSSWHIDLDVHQTRHRQTDGHACTYKTSSPIIPFDRFPWGGKSGQQHLPFWEIKRLRQLLNMIQLPQDSNQLASNTNQWCHHTRWQPLSHECMCSVTSCITLSCLSLYCRPLHGSSGRVRGEVQARCTDAGGRRSHSLSYIYMSVSPSTMGTGHITELLTDYTMWLTDSCTVRCRDCLGYVLMSVSL